MTEVSTNLANEKLSFTNPKNLSNFLNKFGFLSNQYKLNVKKLITHQFKLEDLNEAINLAHKPQSSLKIMINP